MKACFDGWVFGFACRFTLFVPIIPFVQNYALFLPLTTTASTTDLYRPPYVVVIVMFLFFYI